MTPLPADEKRALIEMGLKLIVLHDERSEVFGDINKKLTEMCGDFGPRIPEMVDEAVWAGFLSIMDRMMTGPLGKDADLASYWANEARGMKGGCHIEWPEAGKHSRHRFDFNTVDDVLKYLDARDRDDLRRMKSATA